MAYRELAAGPLHHLHPCPSVAWPFWSGQQLQRAPVVLHGVVARDAAGVPEGEDGAEVECRVERVPGRLGLAGGDGEAGVEARQEALEHGLRLGDGGGPGEVQLGHEAVLEGPGNAFDAALGLRGAGEDQADPQHRQRPRELRGALRPRALLGGGPEDGVTIAVQGERDAAVADHLLGWTPVRPGGSSQTASR